MSTAQTNIERANGTEQVAEVGAWVGLLRAHAAVTRQFNRELIASHGLTINDFEVLIHLESAEGGRLRRVDLAERVLLTASGITRLLDGLERSELVCKASCAADAGHLRRDHRRRPRPPGLRPRLAHRGRARPLRRALQRPGAGRADDLLARLPQAPACPG